MTKEIEHMLIPLFFFGFVYINNIKHLSVCFTVLNIKNVMTVYKNTINILYTRGMLTYSL